jgi:hypothetical protein
MGELLRRLCVKTLECDTQRAALFRGRVQFDSDYSDEDGASPFFFPRSVAYQLLLHSKLRILLTCVSERLLLGQLTSSIARVSWQQSTSNVDLTKLLHLHAHDSLPCILHTVPFNVAISSLIFILVGLVTAIASIGFDHISFFLFVALVVTVGLSLPLVKTVEYL